MRSSQETHEFDTHEVASFSVPRSLEDSILQRMLGEMRADSNVLSVDEIPSTTADSRKFMINYVWLLSDSRRRSKIAQKRLQLILNKYACP